MKFGFGCVVVLALQVTLAAAQTPPPVEAFGRLPWVADVSISPDGHRVAVAVNSRAGESAIIITNLDSSDDQRRTYAVDSTINTCKFETIIFLVFI